MKKIIFLILVALSMNFIHVNAQKNSGIFYSTLYAKEGVYLRGKQIADKADYVFFKDINGDNFDDAVSIYLSGEHPGAIKAALSDGVKFKPAKTMGYIHAPYYWFPLIGDVDGDNRNDICYFNPNTNRVWILFASEEGFAEKKNENIEGNIQSAENTFLYDINSDGKDDLIFGSSAKNSNESEWFIAYSEGDAFSEPVPVGKIISSNTNLIGDIDGQSDPEFLVLNESDSKWDVYKLRNDRLSPTRSFSGSLNLDGGLSNYYLYDVDGDRKDDLISWDKDGTCSWFVNYSTGTVFEEEVKWINNHHAASPKNNITPPEYGFPGTMNGEKSIAMVVSLGKWTGVEFTKKGKTESPTLLDTYESWGADYIPEGGTYDSGDPQKHDEQIMMIHDAGFTYITLDITNGYNDWVDNRALALMERIRKWNNNLQPGQHKIYANISLGRTRGKKTLDEFMVKLNLECKRTWEEYYKPFEDLYYLLDGKPMVIHMIDTGWDFIDQIDSWEGDKTYIKKVASRWMDGTQPGTLGKPNTYGWIVPGVYGNEIHPEMMPVMPGFWNGLTLHQRREGEQYKTQWLKVLENDPESVWVNSFNETWEHTSVEPAYIMIDQFSAHPGICEEWTDHYGNRYDHYYWDMTVQYNQLFMNNVLFEDTYFMEKNNDQIYKVTKNGFVEQEAYPVMAPVLLLPEGFIEGFAP